jgi:hypothetical protein
MKMQWKRSSTASGEKVPQLGEQEIQSIPPLKMFPTLEVAKKIIDYCRSVV